MVNFIITGIYRKVIPFCYRVKIRRFRYRKAMNVSKICFERQGTVFRDHMDEFMFDEHRQADILRIFSLLKKNGVAAFPEMNISIYEKYFTRKLKIKKDPDTDLFYVLLYNNEKLFL